MNARAAGLAGFLLVAVIAKCSACALPQPRVVLPPVDYTVIRFTLCLHAPRPERRACERAYIVYAGTVASTHNR